jgi:hypothetical protein
MARAFLVLLTVGTVLNAVACAQAAPAEIGGGIKKVLPHLLDKAGRHTVSPSLFDRDAYQAQLRNHPDKVSGIRYDVRWTAHHAQARPLTVRVELRGLYEGKIPRLATLEKTVDGRDRVREWTRLQLTGEAYARFGKITAWRATLWSGDQLLDEYKSFLW